MRTRWLFYLKGIKALTEGDLKATLRKGVGIWKFGHNLYFLSLTPKDANDIRKRLSRMKRSYLFVKLEKGYFMQYPMDRYEQFFSKREETKNKEEMEEMNERFEIEGRPLCTWKYTVEERKRLERIDDNCASEMSL
jgi:hypothetical protein